VFWLYWAYSQATISRLESDGENFYASAIYWGRNFGISIAISYLVYVIFREYRRHKSDVPKNDGSKHL
jgi:hypothetical protein